MRERGVLGHCRRHLRWPRRPAWPEAAHEWLAPDDTSPHRNKTPVDAWTSPGTARVRPAGVASAGAEANFEVKTAAAVAVLHTTNGVMDPLAHRMPGNIITPSADGPHMT